MRANGFLTSYGFIWDDLGRISNGPKSTDFEQKPWALARGIQHGGFGQVLYMRANGFLTWYRFIWDDLGRISSGPKSADFEQKPWAIARGFQHGGFRQLL